MHVRHFLQCSKGLGANPRKDLEQLLLLNGLLPDSARQCCGDADSFDWNSSLRLFLVWPYIWFLSLYAYVLIETYLRRLALCIWAEIVGTQPLFLRQQKRALALTHVLAATSHHCHLPRSHCPALNISFHYLRSKN